GEEGPFTVEDYLAGDRGHTQNPAGYYLLHVCVAASYVKDGREGILNELYDCFMVNVEERLQLLKQAAEDCYWLARRRPDAQEASEVPGMDPPRCGPPVVSGGGPCQATADEARSGVNPGADPGDAMPGRANARTRRGGRGSGPQHGPDAKPPDD